MLIAEAEIVPGRCFLTKFYTYVQVIEIVGKRVIYRARSRSPIVRALAARRTASLQTFAPKLRAEVDAGFFPDFAMLDGYEFNHPEVQADQLARYLAERAPHRPFVASS